MSTNVKVPSLGDRVRVTATTSPHSGVAGTVTGLEPNIHNDGSPAVTVTLLTGERIWGHTSRFTTDPLPREATWGDYVTSHGGPEASGWWVTLRWYADSEHPRPEVVGPYPSQEQALAAMQDSLLIDGFAEDTNHNEWLDDVYVADDPASIASVCADYGHRVTLIDPGDPGHFGDPAPEPTVTARSGLLLQVAALHPSSPDQSRPAAEGIATGTDHSPAGPTM
jgi:hypothetical protein